ncbi:hypothetical protein Tco_1224098 [Tanacetum coccineum]
MNQVLNENERLLEQVINKDVVNIIMNSSVDIASMNMHECEKCLKLKTWLLNKKDFVEKEIYDKLFNSFTTLGAINHLARHGLVRVLPKLKFEKDHLCSACAMGKSKKKPHKPKSEDIPTKKICISCTWIFMDQCVSQVLMERSTSFSLSMITLDLHG